jgi:hypothetical protein
MNYEVIRYPDGQISVKVTDFDASFRFRIASYEDPVTDDGTKKSLKGLIQVYEMKGAHGSTITCKEQCIPEEEAQGLLQTIFKDGTFYNATNLEEIKNRLKK